MNTPIRRAIIDVGTNSVKLLIADIVGGSVQPLLERSEQTRLGRGFYRTHRLLTETIAHTAQTVAKYVATADQWQVGSLRVVATSAARDAVNQAELIASIQRSAGVVAQIVSGEQEAAWAFEGVTSDPRFAGHPLLIVDVGGGSSQFVLGRGSTWTFRHSFRLGAVRLLEQLQPADPPAAGEEARCCQEIATFLAAKVTPLLEPALALGSAAHLLFIGTGGTSSVLASMQSGLAAFERERLESTALELCQVKQWLDRLWGLSCNERRTIPGLPADRADVILTGAAIYAVVMETLGLNTLQVSTRGYRFGALLDPGGSMPPKAGADGNGSLR